MAGDFLPIQLIYQGKTYLSQARYWFPKEFRITQIPNNRANEQTSIDYLQNVLISYIKTQRKELNLIVHDFYFQMFFNVDG